MTLKLLYLSLCLGGRTFSRCGRSRARKRSKSLPVWGDDTRVARLIQCLVASMCRGQEWRAGGYVRAALASTSGTTERAAG